MVTDFAQARAKMVDNQIRTFDVTSRPLLAAFEEIAREAFVPADMKKLAYIDDDVEIAPARDGSPARYVMEAAPLARLIQLAAVGPRDVVLEVGCGTGYGSAILSRLAGSVVALECDADLAETAAATLSEMGCDNVAVVVGDLAAGHAAEAPYDAILFSGAVEVLPRAVLDQLRDGGRLVVVEGVGNAARTSVYVRDGETTSHRHEFNCSVKLLPGMARKPEFVF
jgi:protein-L-isoaspartate(D-aspartate) O-methyltransferase